MKQFIVNSKLPQIQLNRLSCVIGKTDVFEEAGLKDIHLKTCYCCSPELYKDVKKTVIEFEAPSKEALEMALQKINIPFDSIEEVTKINYEKR